MTDDAGRQRRADPRELLDVHRGCTVEVQRRARKLSHLFPRRFRLRPALGAGVAGRVYAADLAVECGGFGGRRRIIGVPEANASSGKRDEREEPERFALIRGWHAELLIDGIPARDTVLLQ